MKNRIIIELVCCLCLGVNLQVMGQSTHEKEQAATEIYPFLADIVDAYYAYHLSAPKGLQQLKKFANDIHATYPEEFYFYSTLKRNTFKELKKNKKEITFCSTKCGFSILINGNIIYQYEDDPCCDYITSYRQEDRVAVIANRMRKVHFFKKNGQPILNTQAITEQFITEMKSFMSKYQFDKSNVYMIEYKANRGLFSFCKDSSIQVWNQPFKTEIENFLKSFSCQHKLSRIVFYSYMPTI